MNNITIILIIIGLYFLICRFLELSRDKLMYQNEATRLPSYSFKDPTISLHKIGPNYAFFKKTPSKKVIYHFGGTKSNLEITESTMHYYIPEHYSVFAIDYEGYGCSDGKPCEESTLESAIRGWNYLTHVLGYDPTDIIIYGFSLGGGVACQLACYLMSYFIPYCCLVLKSTFCSINQVIIDKYFSFFNCFETDDRYENSKCVQLLKNYRPIIIIHSQEDNIIPFNHGINLFNEAIKDLIDSDRRSESIESRVTKGRKATFVQQDSYIKHYFLTYAGGHNSKHEFKQLKYDFDKIISKLS